MTQTDLLPKVIAFNGPPRCGKDTAVEFLRTTMGAHPIKFAKPLYAAGAAMLNEPVIDFELKKDEPIFEGSSITRRQLLIAISEDAVKPLFGSAIYGRLAASRMTAVMQELDTEHVVRYGYPVFAISDSGFTEELQAVINVFGAPHVLLIKLTRPDCTFMGDSREYVDEARLPFSVRTEWVDNAGTLEDYQSQLRDVVGGWLGRG